MDVLGRRLPTDPPPLHDQEAQRLAIVATQADQTGDRGIPEPHARKELPLAPFIASLGSSRAGMPSIQRGFLDSGRHKCGSISRKETGAARRGECMDSVGSDRRVGPPKAHAAVPECLRIPLTSEEERYLALHGAMEPTHNKMAAIMRDNTLMSGFDDPEVMTAVHEIATRPGAMQNYTHNAKVKAFYKQMAKFVESQVAQQRCSNTG